MNVNPVRGIFITGTGTDAGKTVISAGLLRLLRNYGINAAPMKPVQTGMAINENGEAYSPDIFSSMEASGFTFDRQLHDHMVPCRFKTPCSPHLACRIESGRVDLDIIKNSLDTLSSAYDFIIAEGAGGIMVPLGETCTNLDLMKVLGLPVLLVIRNGLGCISDALSSIYVLKREGINLAGAVMCCTSPATSEDEMIRKDNPEIIGKMGGIPVLAMVDYIDIESRSRGEFWAEVERELAKSGNLLIERVTGNANGIFNQRTS